MARRPEWGPEQEYRLRATCGACPRSDDRGRVLPVRPPGSGVEITIEQSAKERRAVAVALADERDVELVAQVVGTVYPRVRRFLAVDRVGTGTPVIVER